MPIIFILLFSLTCSAQESSTFYVRLNQAGYLGHDLKSGLIFSAKPIKERSYFILDKTGKIISAGSIADSKLRFDGFNYAYTFDFSDVIQEGKYRLRIKGMKDIGFNVDNKTYNAVRDSLILFFRVQRCGPTDPMLHEPCHLSDATSVEGFSENIVDVTGGWHDAGDYIKFLSTAAYTTYMLLFAYEFDKEKFGFDNDDNSVPDILEEARVGLDWLMRCKLRNDLLVTQVQDLNDHNATWRLPENDSLQFNRPAFTGIGKNIIGLYAAALAIGSRIWLNRFYDEDFSAKLLSYAEDVYSVYREVPDIDSVHSGFYQDGSFAGKLALGAAELYITTKNNSYLQDAKIFADSAGSDFWWSWGNINSLVHYRLTKMGFDYSEYILNNLQYFRSVMEKNLFSEGAPFTWGTTNTLLGISLQAILYKELTGNRSFDSMSVLQRDYILGRNPWGLCFIYGIGKTFPRSLHSQVAFFNKGYLPGALSAGPAPSELIEKFQISRTSVKYNAFNSGSAKYFDDYKDYITNEPTISGNATALFVFGFFSDKMTVTD